MTVTLHRVHTYEELEGAQGREVFFRPHRYRATDLLPLHCEVVLAFSDGDRPGALVDVSQNGAAFEWPDDLPVSVGDHLETLAVRFDEHEPYRGEARVGSVRDLNGIRVVGVSFEGPLLPIDGILELRTIKSFAQTGVPPALWRVPGHERFKVLISELRLYLESLIYCGFFARSVPTSMPVLSMEIRPRPGESSALVIANGKRALKYAWARLSHDRWAEGRI